MSGRAWIVALVLLAALGFVTYLFVLQNSARTTALSLDLGVAAWATSAPLPVVPLLGAAFGSGFLVALVALLPRLAGQGRRVRALERQIALTAPAENSWRS